MWYDVFVLAVLIVGMVRGAARGVVWQLAGIAGIVLCLVFAETISAVGSPLVGLEPPLNQWVVMFVAYLFFSFLSFGFARLINSALEKAELKEYNKHLGAIFGLVKGVALCLVATFFLVTLSETTHDWLKDSKSARYAAIVMDRLHPVMPGKLRELLVKYIRELDAPDLDLKYTNTTAQQPADPHRPATEQQGWDPFSTATPPPQTGGSQPALPTTAEAIDALLRKIPALANDAWTRETARIVYESTPTASRQQLLQDLKDAAPAMLFAVLQQWKTQPPQPTTPSQPAGTQPSSAGFGWTGAGGAQNVGFSQPPAASAESLRSEISTRLARTSQDQSAYEQYISDGLRGMPDGVSLGVLQDWLADLTGGTDPDPQTNVSTTLDQRIIRQLTIQRVSVYQLSQELQERLMKAHRQ